MDNVIIGIDFGTTNSVVALYENGAPTVLTNAEGAPTTPSIVLYNNPNDIIVGELAKRQLAMYPRRTVCSVKRLLGRHYSELTPELLSVGNELVKGADDNILLKLDNGMTVSPEAVASEILKKMKATADIHLGGSVSRAVITVPAYYNDTQRQATKHAAEMAGLQVARIINEPTAAALSYSITHGKEQRAAVFDFGGGTLDVSILQISGDVVEVLATNGDTYLGGDNFDQALCGTVCKQFEEEHQVDLKADAQAFSRLLGAIELCKCELSVTKETILSLPFITIAPSGPIHLNRTITRGEFEKLLEPFVPRIKDCCYHALEDAHLSPADIDVVLPVGGSSRIPYVRALLAEIFGRDPLGSVDPEASVALGAAVQGSVLTGALKEVLLLDVTPLSLGIEVAGGVFSTIIPRNSSIPVVQTRNFTTIRDNQRSVKVHILQGERRIAKENHTLGVFMLDGIAPAPREIPEIEVSFQIDSNGILNVSAKDMTSGVQSSITIISFGVSDPEEAEREAAKAEMEIKTDMAYLQLVKARNKGNALAEELRAYLEESVLSDDFRLEIKECLFKYDVASNAGIIQDMEEQVMQMMKLLSRLEDSSLAGDWKLPPKS